MMKMANNKAFMFVSLLLLLQFYSGTCELQLNYYSQSCPKAEKIVQEQVAKLYYKHGNTAISWIRNLFHDSIVGGCDASLLLETAKGIESEKSNPKNFGMRNFKYINTIKEALEAECPTTVSCADIIALSARDGAAMLHFGGPQIPMKTGRKDSKKSYASEIDSSIPSHNATMPSVLERFQSIGIDTEGTVALLGGHSVGRVHCRNLVDRLYPEIDPTLDPVHGAYLRKRCPDPHPDPFGVVYSRNDLETSMILDNQYYKNILKHKGLLKVDQELVTDPNTGPYVVKMAADNDYFRAQFTKALIKLSENNPILGNEGEIRKDCRFVNRK